ncbi:hypothetical protein [uncultured Gammaproteobacteria bacterium]|nr:hypothetical protein [uncultured Gammaproteobacteria bacterium]
MKSLYQLGFVCFFDFYFWIRVNMVSLFVGQLCIFLHVSLLFLVGLKGG